MRRGSEKVLKGMPPVLEFAKRAEEHVKGMVTPSTLFEEFGFNYIGPIDGHDLDVLLDYAEQHPQADGPQFLHVVTQKGKGYAHGRGGLPAVSRREQVRQHPGIVAKPVQRPKAARKPTYTQVFGHWLCDMAQQDERLVGITPAMCEGSGLVGIRARVSRSAISTWASPSSMR